MLQEARNALTALVLSIGILTCADAQDWSWTFQRGDVNDDQVVTIGDVISGLGQLFAGEPIRCADALDVNDDGLLAIDDPIHLAHYLFLGGASPAQPFPSCGTDDTPDGLGCLGTLLTCSSIPTGDPMFLPGPTLSSEIVPWPWSLDALDLDGDGDVDLITSGQVSTQGGVSVLINEGGVFTAQVYPVGGSLSDHVYGFATGDIDADGDLDIMAGLRFARDVRTLLGNGDGTFLLTATVLGHLRGIAAVDLVHLNFDSALDLVVTTFSSSGVGGATYVEIRFGNGDGTFTSITEHLVSSGSGFPLTRFDDFDSDGHLDLIVGMSSSSAASEFVWFPGQGGGTFAAPVSRVVPWTIHDWQLDDLDGDGTLEIVAASDESELHLYRAGTDAIVAQGVLPMTAIPAAFSLGDLNGDGTLDIAAGEGFSDDVRATLVGDPIWLVSEGTYPAENPFQTAIADLDSDGDQDIAVLGYTGEITILSNQIVP